MAANRPVFLYKGQVFENVVDEGLCRIRYGSVEEVFEKPLDAYLFYRSLEVSASFWQEINGEERLLERKFVLYSADSAC